MRVSGVLRLICVSMVLLGAGVSRAQAQTVSFGTGVSYDTGAPTNAIAVADINHDNHLDLIVTACECVNVIRVRLGDGLGGFGDPVDFPTSDSDETGQNPFALAIGDFNGDGHPDVATANELSDDISILLGDGLGGFSVPATFPTGCSPIAIVAANFDADTSTDLAVVNGCGSAMQVFLNDGLGGFTESADSPFLLFNEPSDLAAGDLDGNGTIDLVVTDYFDSTVTVLLGDGAGGFTPGQILPTIPGAVAVTLGDLNDDGTLDMAIACLDSSVVLTYRGVGDGTFAGALFGFTDTDGSLRDVVIGDFNGDGRADVAAAILFFDEIQVLPGDGAGGLGPAETFLTNGIGPMSLAAGDFNEDGKTDVAAAHDLSTDSRVLLNETCCFITVSRDGSGAGTVTSTPARVNCGVDCFLAFPNGSSVTLTATPAPGSRFAGWTGPCFGTGPCTFSPGTDDSVTATFDIALVLSATPFPGGAVGSPYSTQATTTNGVGPFTFTLEAGTLPSNTTLDSNGTIHGLPTQAGGFAFTLGATDSGGLVGTRDYLITIVAGATATSSPDRSATYSQGSSQIVNLQALVTGGVSVGSAGSVTFTVRDASTAIIGVPVTSPVVSAGTTASYTLPAGTNAQTLTVTAVYSGTANFVTSSGTSALVVGAAASATAGADASATFSAAGQIVPLSATVTSAGGTVNGGTVTFTVRTAGSAIVGVATTSGTVVGGAASVSYTLPGGTSPQQLFITAVYNGSTNFGTSTDATHTLTIGVASTAIAAANASATFSTAGQTIPLSATVTSAGAGGALNAGTVTFTVRDAGNAIVGVPTTSGTVSAGAASVNYTLPGGTPPQTLSITATFSGLPNYDLSSDATHTLTIGAAASATAAANASATFNTAGQVIPLSATVTSASGPVSAGTVTFTVRDAGSAIVGVATTSGTVSGGAAFVNYSLPGGTNAQTLSITAVYNGSANVTGSTDATHTLVLGPAATATAGTGGSVSFSAAAQSVPLTATVTSGAGTVGTGIVTFTARTAANVVVGSSVTGAVVGGAASATYTLPGGTPAQTLTVTASYGATTNFSASAGTAALSIGCSTLTVAPGSLAGLRLGRSASLGFTASEVNDATFTLTGTVPGMSFTAGTLSGVPAALGRFDLTVTATSAGTGCTGSRAYALTVMRSPAFVTSPGGGAPLVRAFDDLGTETRSFLAEAPLFADGVRVAMGDVTGDGVADTITAPGLGSASALVRVFDGVTGVQVRQFVAFPSAPPGGVYVAAGDVNADGVADIIAGRDGDLPEVRLFDGRTGRLISDFFAYNPATVGGVRVAVGDVNGDGLGEIITGTPPGAPPEVRVFSGDGAPLAAFMAYDPAFGGGVYVAAGDVDGDGRADIVTGAGAGGGPHVRVFSGADLHELRGFFAYAPAFMGGVRVAAGDLDMDGHAEIITAAGAGGGPHVRVWDGATGAETLGFFAYDPAFTDGVFVAAAAPQSRMAIDTPGAGATVGPMFPIGGWALQGTGTTDSGVDAIDVWVYPVSGAAPIFLGRATLGTPRPDVARLFGGIFAESGYSLEAGPLPAGTYDLVVFVRNARSGVFSDRRVVRIVVSP